MALECPFAEADLPPLHRTRIMDLLASLHFSLSITGPICLVLVLGIWLKRLGLLPDSFVESASRLVFQVTLPALLFLSMVRTDFPPCRAPWLILYGLLGTPGRFPGAGAAGGPFHQRAEAARHLRAGQLSRQHRIMGLAYVQNAYGPEGIGAAALLLWGGHRALQRARGDHPDPQPGGGKGIGPILRGSARIPPIIAILAALPFGLLGIELPQLVISTGNYFANMTLPLACSAPGPASTLKALRGGAPADRLGHGQPAVLHSGAAGDGAWGLGFSPRPLGILFLISSTPPPPPAV